MPAFMRHLKLPKPLQGNSYKHEMFSFNYRNKLVELCPKQQLHSKAIIETLRGQTTQFCKNLTPILTFLVTASVLGDAVLQALMSAFNKTQ